MSNCGHSFLAQWKIHIVRVEGKTALYYYEPPPKTIFPVLFGLMFFMQLCLLHCIHNLMWIISAAVL